MFIEDCGKIGEDVGFNKKVVRWFFVFGGDYGGMEFNYVWVRVRI